MVLPMLDLRPYQKKALEHLDRALYNKKNPLLVLPTGTGKSVIIAEFVKRSLECKASCMMLTHVSELVLQNYQKLCLLIDEKDTGIYSAGLNQKDTDKKVIFGTVQSVYSALKNKNVFGRRDYVIVDEAHLISDDAQSMYRTVLKVLRQSNPQLQVIGLSATPYRLKSGLLTEQQNAIFDAICYNLNNKFNALIKEGFLSSLVTYKPDTFFNMADVHIRAGEFKTDEVNTKFDDQELKDACINIKHIAKSSSRKHILVFVSSIDIAERVNDIFNRIGLVSCAVHSKKGKTLNDFSILAFKQGKIKALVNVDQLTTGFDAPFIDMIAMLRPTISTALHVQMLGRGTRPAEGKTDCLILDFVGNIERLGPINDPYIPSKKKGAKGEAPVKSCPNCSMYMHASARECPNCGQKFEPKGKEYKLKDGTVLVDDPATFNSRIIDFLNNQNHCNKAYFVAGIERVSVEPYVTQRYEQIVLVKYQCVYLKDEALKQKTFKQYLFFNRSEKWARNINFNWWKHFTGSDSLPASTDEFFTRQNEIKNGRYMIVSTYADAAYPKFYFNVKGV